jgi:hypothetical protein
MRFGAARHIDVGLAVPGFVFMPSIRVFQAPQAGLLPATLQSHFHIRCIKDVFAFHLYPPWGNLISAIFKP